MKDLTKIYKVGQAVSWIFKEAPDFKTRQHDGTIREVYTDHLIVAFPEVNDHCWFEEGFNLETLFNR